MNRKILLSLISLLVLFSASAQTGQNPKGLYKLRKFIYENGSSSNPGFSQYKYAADSVGLLIFYRATRNINQWSNMNVEIRESYPLVWTGEKPQGADGHGTQIFNVDDRQFYFKWYNESWPNMSNLKEFITEVYVNEGMEKEVVQAFNMFENKMNDNSNRFCGWWVRVAVTANTDGSGRRSQAPTIWKAYSPELSMVVRMADNGKALGCNTTNTIRYENDSTIYEIGHRCDIHWLNEDCHALTFVQENGKTVTELWVRSGLPETWQSVFHTDIPTQRDGAACLRDAVAALFGGEPQKADGFIAEAIDKDVRIDVLTQSVMSMAMYLLADKRQYQECADFSVRQLERIKAYSDAGHDHTMVSKVNTFIIDMSNAIATYRSGSHEQGKKLMEDHLSMIDNEINQYRTVNGMDTYINLLYYTNLMMYSLAYDILGTERTLLYLDALTLMAPAVTSQNKPLLLNCRANCYLLNGDKDSAKELWQQIKDVNPDYLKNQPADNPLKKAFGE